jgi:hypothetical protein
MTKGNQTERAAVVGYATDTALTNIGWPPLESVDTSHSSVTDYPKLLGYSTESVRFFGRPVETWQVEVDMDVTPLVGTYRPGDNALFNVQTHPWVPAGTYTQRILGWQQAQGPNRLMLLLQAQGGVL